MVKSMRNTIAIITMTILTTLTIRAEETPPSAKETQATPAIEQMEPQVQAMANWLMSLKDENVEQFKNSYSPETQKAIEGRGLTWDEALGKARAAALKNIGTDYTLADFGFTFEGDEESGKVITTYKDKKLGGMSVKKVGEAWKLNEL